MKTKFRVQGSGFRGQSCIWQGGRGKRQGALPAFRFPRITNRELRVTSNGAFTLVEIALAIAVMAIGLVGILALFPLGLRATRGAADDAEMAMIAQEYIAKYQQVALDTNNYVVPAGSGLLTNNSYSTNVYVSGGSLLAGDLQYTVDVLITNDGFPQMDTGSTNLLSRVIINISRPGSKTNTYITEVARYAK